jgi:hypothetical protein
MTIHIINYFELQSLAPNSATISSTCKNLNIYKKI